MRKAFLMSASITVKSNFMIVYQNPRNLLLQFPLRLHAPFSHGQSKVPFPHLKMRRQIHRRFLRLRGHLYSLYAEPGRTAGLQRFFPFCFCFGRKLTAEFIDRSSGNFQLSTCQIREKALAFINGNCTVCI